MRYIEVQDGISIKKSEVEAVERSDIGSRVFLKSGKEMETAFDYLLLLQLLEDDSSEHEVENKLDSIGKFDTFPRI